MLDDEEDEYGVLDRLHNLIEAIEDEIELVGQPQRHLQLLAEADDDEEIIIRLLEVVEPAE